MKNLARLGLLLSVPAYAGGVGCGKDDNLHPPALVEFAHSFPEAPRPLDEHVVEPWTSGHPIAATMQFLYLVDRDNRELVKLDRATLAKIGSVALGGKPEQLVVSDDGTIFVALRSGDVVRVSPDLVIEKRRHLGTDVFGIALSPDATTVYATLPYEQQLFTLDADDLAQVAEPIDVLDTPRGVSASSNKWIMVVRQFGDALKIAVDDDNLPDEAVAIDAPLRIGNPADFVNGGFRLPGLHAVRALAAVVSPETGGAFIAHVAAAPGTEQDLLSADTAAPVDGGAVASDGYGGSSLPSASFPIPTRPVEVTVTQTDNLGMPTLTEQQVPVQDTLTGEPMTALLDQPSDVAHHPKWSLLFIAGYGTDNVLVLSTAQGDPMRSPLAIIDVGHAPRGIAFSPEGDKAYVLNEFDLTVSEIDMAPFFKLQPMEDGHPVFGTSGGTSTDMSIPVPSSFDSAGAPMMPNQQSTSATENPNSARVRPFRLSAKKAVAYGVDPMPAAVRRGARVFTYARNANLSHAGEFACGTCHFEGTEDKLVWFITDGPRQTPALAGRLQGTAPFNWAGSKDHLVDNMAQTVERMGGKGLSQNDLEDLQQFLLFGLEAPANPNISPDGQLTVDQLAGQAIFNDKTVGCSGCHRPEQSFTDGLTHIVGTANQVELTHFEFVRAKDPDANPPWNLNTPSLKGVFYTAPYLHDGSAATLDDVLDRTGDTMGKTSQLTQVQKDQLIAYLMTL